MARTPQQSSTVDFKRALVLAGCLGLSLAAWDLPFLAPLKLLAVAAHETGHGLASWIVGGSINHIRISANESGECLSMIPDRYFARIVVSSGGYVGAAFFGAVFLFLTFRFRWGKPMLWVATAWMAFIGVFFGRDLFTVLFCLGMTAVFGLAARYVSNDIAASINSYLASFTALYSVMDLKDDLWNSQVRAQSDAAILASTSGIPAVIWAVLWTALSLTLVAVGSYWALRRPQSKLLSASRPP